MKPRGLGSSLVSASPSFTPAHHDYPLLFAGTGVYSDGDDTNSAAAVVDDVNDAVDWILEKHSTIESGLPLRRGAESP